MSIEIVTIGGLLVEMMRKEIDQPFSCSADLVGPFPSGDVAIFISVAALLGGKCGMIGGVGDDAFGHCLTNRLMANGVNVSMIRTIHGATTGTAFVAYFGDGGRSFIYHWRHAAAGMISVDDVRSERLKDVKWAHVTGVTMSSNDNCRDAVIKLIESLPTNAKLSFDPNIRPEIITAEEIRRLCAPILERADIVFPSRSEAMMFRGTATDEAGCRDWAREGKLVVLKLGAAGCRIFRGVDCIDVPAYTVDEVDPTGAGDSFCAGFITALNDGKSLYEAGRFANAVGALSVLKKGPMEGAPTRGEVEAFMQSND